MKTMNMPDKMEYDWFKPSKHEVIHLRWFKNIHLQNSQQNLNLKSANLTKSRNKNNCVFGTWKQNSKNGQWNAFKMKNVSNTDIKKLKCLNHRHKQTEM